MIDVPSGQAEQPRLTPNHQPTGIATVDEVIESLEQLEGTPVHAHVQAFEAAHEKLREALADTDIDRA